MADEVRLVDLEVIKRYSLAVRQESAPAEDLLAVLDASRDAVLAAMGPAASEPATPAKAKAKATVRKARSPRKATTA